MCHLIQANEIPSIVGEHGERVITFNLLDSYYFASDQFLHETLLEAKLKVEGDFGKGSEKIIPVKVQCRHEDDPSSKWEDLPQPAPGQVVHVPGNSSLRVVPI